MVYSSASFSISEMEDEVLKATAIDTLANNSQSLSRRTRLVKIENHFGGSLSADGAYRPGSIDDGQVKTSIFFHFILGFSKDIYRMTCRLECSKGNKNLR